jgi:hypothetical protein
MNKNLDEIIKNLRQINMLIFLKNTIFYNKQYMTIRLYENNTQEESNRAGV